MPGWRIPRLKHDSDNYYLYLTSVFVWSILANSSVWSTLHICSAGFCLAALSFTENINVNCESCCTTYFVVEIKLNLKLMYKNAFAIYISFVHHHHQRSYCFKSQVATCCSCAWSSRPGRLLPSLYTFTLFHTLCSQHSLPSPEMFSHKLSA